MRAASIAQGILSGMESSGAIAMPPPERSRCAAARLTVCRSICGVLKTCAPCRCGDPRRSVRRIQRGSGNPQARFPWCRCWTPTCRISDLTDSDSLQTTTRASVHSCSVASPTAINEGRHATTDQRPSERRGRAEAPGPSAWPASSPSNPALLPFPLSPFSPHG